MNNADRCHSYYEKNRAERISAVSAYQRANREKVNAKNRAWRKKNAEKVRQSVKAINDLNRDRKRRQQRAWKMANPAKVAASLAARRARLSMAIPKWADRSAIRQVYAEARALTLLTGVEHQVDHIVPMRSPLVCGLHCETNLQIMTGLQNREKCNRLEDAHG